jgi:hypothetical protein
MLDNLYLQTPKNIQQEYLYVIAVTSIDLLAMPKGSRLA